MELLYLFLLSFSERVEQYILVTTNYRTGLITHLKSYRTKDIYTEQNTHALPHLIQFSKEIIKKEKRNCSILHQ